MKKIICMMCAAAFASALLCGCDAGDVKKTAEKVGDQIETIASEFKENVDDMRDNATVSDGDGYIGEDHSAAPTAPLPTENMTDGDGGYDADPTANSDHI